MVFAQRSHAKDIGPQAWSPSDHFDGKRFFNPTLPTAALRGARILIVEDESILALDLFPRHQSRTVTVGLQLAAQVMRANAGFHANQARRHCGEPRFDLAAGPLLRQHDRAASIEADEVERILANVDAHGGNGRD